MNIGQWPLWRAGIFRNIKSMVSTPTRSVVVERISEMGIITREHLPMSIGFASDDKDKLTWLVAHALKVQTTDGEQVQIVSERSYYPLDTCGILTDEEKKRIPGRLKEVGIMRYNRTLSSVIQHGTTDNPHIAFLNRMAAFCFVLDIICFIVFMVK